MKQKVMKLIEAYLTRKKVVQGKEGLLYVPIQIFLYNLQLYIRSGNVIDQISIIMNKIKR